MNSDQDGSIEHIIHNPSKYSSEESKFAKYMKSRFEEQGIVKYDQQGANTVADWVKDYLDLREVK